jgi:hypothetical protein
MTKAECLELIETLKKSCDEGQDGDWDCSTDEGRDGFSDMRDLLEQVQSFVEGV